MQKQTIPVEQLDLQPFTMFDPEGLLLVSGTSVEDANVMTIGWGLFGTIWGKPVAMVMVRPTRHTWKFISKAPDFTINWLAEDRQEALQLCGSKSGRDLNKFAAASLQPVQGIAVGSPILAESVLSLECRTLYKDMLHPEQFAGKSLLRHYANNDYHGLFYGEVVAASGIERFRRA